jgi:uncharacterized protein YneF (UPF0154 family)
MAACGWVYLADDAMQNSFRRKPKITSYFTNAMMSFVGSHELLVS